MVKYSQSETKKTKNTKVLTYIIKIFNKPMMLFKNHANSFLVLVEYSKEQYAPATPDNIRAHNSQQC